MEKQKTPFLIIRPQRVRLHKAIHNLFLYMDLYSNRGSETNLKYVEWVFKHKNIYFEL